MPINGIDVFLNKLTYLRRTVDTEIKERLPKQCAVTFRNVLYKNIVSQRYASSYKPLDIKYEERKKKKGVFNLGFWRWTSSLLGQLRVFKDPISARGWFMGVIPDTVNKEGDDITEYGLANEKIRPLFKPSTVDFANEEYHKVARRSLYKLVRTWVQP